ncbi:MogA/MoaB family molybdenum cofactor biosynthesis protein [Arthrobacter sp. 35W]|uniref:MogA/MoaB family molybdenum cofactor biosynthesis protein n=1 Tax=Arthrobacter sp. 35W TaxID=1132441 RepID=UPI00040FD434|nr:MogA/MoaB family molybdenum cofactor biosynthesis protein [Arthrobacter sp. 35W]
MSSQPRIRRAAVVVASSRAAAGIYADTSAPVLSQWLAAAGFEVVPPRIVPDGAPVAEVLRELLESGPSVILTTGGTGLSADDLTPEMTLPLLDRQIPGIMEAIRAAGAASTPLAALSRGYAGTAGHTLVVNLPGSAGGIKDGLRVLQPLIGHLCDQLEGSHEH